jgi:DNA repair exonuclease SbcCD nuclease subunit
LNGSRPDTEVRILHTSDNHIDQISTCAALGKVVDKANELKVDMVILAGDFFDNARVRDEVVFETVRQLGRLDMPVVLLPGNHDQLDQYTIYNHPGFKDLPWQVNLLRNPEGETVLFHDLKVNVWGRPTYDHHMEFRPLEGAPPRNGPWWHVGIAHGFYVKPGEPIERSSPILAYEIEATGYDYVALGHSDFFEDLSQGTVRAAYSGAPILTSDGRELGSVCLVHLHPNWGVDFRQVPLAESE